MTSASEESLLLLHVCTFQQDDGGFEMRVAHQVKLPEPPPERVWLSVHNRTPFVKLALQVDGEDKFPFLNKVVALDACVTLQAREPETEARDAPLVSKQVCLADLAPESAIVAANAEQ